MEDIPSNPDIETTTTSQAEQYPVQLSTMERILLLLLALFFILNIWQGWRLKIARKGQQQ
jgi:hypothetical protein